MDTRLPCPSPAPGVVQTHVHRVGDVIQWSHPLSSPSPPAFNLSHHQGLSNELVLHIRWPKYWSFSFNISLSNEYSGLISFSVDWWISSQSKVLSRVFSNATVQIHQSFGAQLSLVSNSHIHMITGKIMALTRWTFVSKVMSLLFNILSRLVIAFCQRSNHLLFYLFILIGG